MYNKRSNGNSFTEFDIQIVWEKGSVIPSLDSNIYRKDKCGAIIKRSEYGNTQSKYGWEIDHMKPLAKYGTDDLFNLQPLQWENNRHKSDNYPSWNCIINV